MKAILNLLLKNSEVVQKVCDIGAKFVVIAVGGFIIGQEIFGKKVVESEKIQDKPAEIGFKVRKS